MILRWIKTRRAVRLIKRTFGIRSHLTDLQVFKFARFAIVDSQFRGLAVPSEVTQAFDWLDNNL